MDRREFLATGLAGGAAMTAGMLTRPARADLPTGKPGRFRLNYAPHFGMFRNLAGDDPADQIRFMHDEGFCAVEDNGLNQRPKAWLQRVRRAMDRCNMTMGAMTASADYGNPTFASGRADMQSRVLSAMKDSLEIASRMNARWLTIVPGRTDRRLSVRRQMENAVELLQRCAELCEREDRVLILEPINRSGMFLQTVSQGREICRAVDSPACKLLFDVSDRPLSTEQLMAGIDDCWNEIAYFQLGDNPGRKEPGTGEIDFHKILRHITSKNFTGVLGMDHGNSQPGEEGELRVIDAYLRHEMNSI